MAVYCEGQRVIYSVLDFDNCFYEYNEGGWEIARLRLLSSLGIKTTPGTDIYNEFVTNGDTLGWKFTYAQMGGTDKDYHEITHAVMRDEFIQYDPLLVDVLTELSRHVERMIIFSGSHTKPIHEALNIIFGPNKSVINEVIGSDMLRSRYAKPDVRAYREFVSAYNIPAGETLYTDDNTVDLLNGRGVGMLPVKVGQRHAERVPEGVPVILSLHHIFDALDVRN